MALMEPINPYTWRQSPYLVICVYSAAHLADRPAPYFFRKISAQIYMICYPVMQGHWDKAYEKDKSIENKKQKGLGPAGE